jgi:nitroimidazol reductase NimA-like FMN-containing flavoprotein (pyridoxamine 5'-phosphate oxidase superfamily)
MTEKGDIENEAQELLKEEELCTLATASKDGIPEAATVRYMSDDDFNIYINSGSTYRKYQNMKENPRVAVVINGEYRNIQLEGEAEEVAKEDSDYIVQMYKHKYGRSKYLTNDESVFFKIKTDWVRILIDGSYPPEYQMIVGSGDTDPHDEL